MTTDVPGHMAVLRFAVNKGPLAQIWLAANMSNLSKNSILQTEISKSAQEIAKVSGCEDILNIPINDTITLRTSGELLQGIVRVYSKQTSFLLTDIKDTLTKISSLFSTNRRVNTIINKHNTITRIDQLVLEDAVTEGEVLTLPGLEFLQNTYLPESLLRKDDDLTHRKVTGAAPWDQSLEIGRRFNPDENLENQNDSSLNLDFDLNTDNWYAKNKSADLSKSWGEGTRQGSQHVGLSSNLLYDDNFPVDDDAGTAMDWNLDFDDNNNNDNNNTHNGDESDRSIEGGRRADDTSMSYSHTDFGFDLDIGKGDALANVDDGFEKLDLPLQNDQQINKNSTSTTKKTKGDVNLINTTLIEEDDVTEIKDPQLLGKEQLEPQNLEQTQNITSSKTHKLTRKRLCTEVSEYLSYLPSQFANNIMTNCLLKKRKLSPDTIIPDEELNMDLSLQLGDISDNNNSFDISAHDNENSSIMNENLDDPAFLDNIDDNQDGIDSNDTTRDKRSTLYAQTVRLAAGGTTSKKTIELVGILQSKASNGESCTFSHVLKQQSEKKENNIQNKTTNISKKEASRAFFDILSLTTEGCIDLKQKESFEEISISARPPLFEKFIVA